MFETITWIVTNNCNLNCKYCNFAHRELEEATLEDKLKTLHLLKDWPESDKRFICLLGGDIIDMPGVNKFLIKLNNLQFEYGFQTSASNYETMKYLTNHNQIKNLSISVDPIDMTDYSRSVKAFNGLYWAGYLKALNPGIDIHATITVDRLNIEYVPRTVRILSGLGIWTEITAVHWAKNHFDLVPPKSISNGFMDSKEDRDKIDRMTTSLIEMKHSGYLIHTTEDILKHWKDYATNLNWKCNSPVNAVIDADLSMRLCLHVPGNRVRQWSVLDLLTEEDWQAFLKDWKSDQEELCPKCFWDCQYEVMNQNMDEVHCWFNHKR